MFDDHINFRQHRIQYHNASENDYFCGPCRRNFRNENDLNTHFRSSIHRPSTFRCPGADCGRRFVSEAALVNHCESGACPSRADRYAVNRLATSLDRGNIITNPNRLLTHYSGSERCTIWATERCWKGDAYECCLCHREKLDGIKFPPPKPCS